jgi:hypothetical protein
MAAHRPRRGRLRDKPGAHQHQRTARWPRASVIDGDTLEIPLIFIAPPTI